jgi:2-aminoadipate transaminase
MKYDFAVGQTNPETFPVEAFKRAAIRAIEDEYASFNQYPGGKGHPQLRALMAQRESEREGVSVDPEMMALTNGSMQGVTLVGQALMDAPGDQVITEAFTYSGTIAAYKGIGLDMVGISVDESGMRMDHLEAHLRSMKKKPKFIYALTAYQNPTGVNLSLERRHRLIELAAEYEIPVVEDNCYGDVHFDGDKPPALYALSDDAHHIYLCSLSKIFAPGVRLGYVLARRPYFEQIVGRRFDAGSNTFAAAVMAKFYEENLWTHCEAANVALKRKRDLLVSRLKDVLEDECVWSHPTGGLFLWLRLPEDTDLDRLRAEATDKGFNYAEGRDFHVTGERVPYIRLAFGHVPDDAIVEGIPVLAQCVQRARSSNAARDFTSLFDD